MANKSLSAATPRQADECADKTAAQKKGYRDLAQSVRASNAAEEAAWLSYQQAEIALVGAALLIFTLGATAWAAWAAADAAEIAEKGASAAIQAAKAADKAVGIASETAQRQLRAYISVVPTEASYDQGKGVISLKVQIRNVGQTPAREARWYTGMGPWFFPLKEDPSGGQEPTSPSNSKIAIHPGTEIGATSSFEISLHEGRALAKSPMARLMYLAQVDYFDIFGKEHTTRICVTLPPPVLSRILDGPPGALNYDWADYHNDAT